MKYPDIEVSIDRSVFNAAPKYERIVVFATREKPSEISEEAYSEDISHAITSLIAKYGDTPVTDIQEVASWRSAFRAAGINPTKFRPSMEALLRRALKNELRSLGDPLIDAGTICTLEFTIPVGVHVVDEVADGEKLSLSAASGKESFVTLAGESETVQAGELVYKTDAAVMTRRWAWRQGAFGSIHADSRFLAVNMDFIDGGARTSRAMDRLCELLNGAGCRVHGSELLTVDQPVANSAKARQD